MKLLIYTDLVIKVYLTDEAGVEWPVHVTYSRRKIGGKKYWPSKRFLGPQENIPLLGYPAGWLVKDFIETRPTNKRVLEWARIFVS